MALKPTGEIIPVNIEDEMRRSYLDYAMSVIVSRALPDVRDGLKPVHRRILYSMNINGNGPGSKYRKSARIVGDVMGKYHPHGDMAIYEAMVRLAQGFSMRLPLVDGQGNFGSLDNDPPAASRYTEARLARAAKSLLDDLDKDTVDFQDNYDETEVEPVVLPAGFPNLLVNGAQGIAVGMATNIPPHNLGEVIDACCAYLDNRDITLEELLACVPAPDFPTGGTILGRAGSASIYATGRGAVVLRAKCRVETTKNSERIIVDEIPYQVNKAKLMERIAECMKKPTGKDAAEGALIEGISVIRDESDRQGLSIVIELKRGADADVVLSRLYRYTAMQVSFNANMLALNNGQPQLLSLKDIIQAFVAFREEVVSKRTYYLLTKARERIHVLIGLLVAVGNLDAVIELIRGAKNSNAAREALLEGSWPHKIGKILETIDDKNDSKLYQFSEEQAKAILEMRLSRLTGLERDKITLEVDELVEEITTHLNLLRNRDVLISTVREELETIKETFATPRRTEIQDDEFDNDVEDLIPREDMVVMVSTTGYIKRVPLATYRAQRRGGKGRVGMSLRDDDVINQMFVASTLTPVLFFSDSGKAYRLKVYKLPLGSPQSKGKALIPQTGGTALLPMNTGERIAAIMPMPEDETTWKDQFIMFATASGYVRRNSMADFIEVRANGKIAMKFEGEDENDTLVSVLPCTEEEDIFLSTRNGNAIRFPSTAIRVFSGRSSLGTRGIKLAEGDSVISMSTLPHEEVETDIRFGYLNIAKDFRDGNVPSDDDLGDPDTGPAMSRALYDTLAERERFILSITEKGFGIRCSSYDYRCTGKGGEGLENMELRKRKDSIVSAFPVRPGDEIILVTSSGTIIRCPLDDIRIARRRTQGITVFDLAKGDRVVSVARLEELTEEEGENDG